MILKCLDVKEKTYKLFIFDPTVSVKKAIVRGKIQGNNKLINEIQ